MLLPRSAPLILSMACASVVLAQPQREIQIGIGAPAVAAGAKDLQSVYVRDSGVASERLTLAERMERLQEWDKAADVYQEIIEKYADRVVPTRTDANDQVTQYTSVALVVQEKLARWPAAGLDAYRRRYEDTAREKLDTAPPGNTAALLRVLTLYFPTDAGKDAGLRLMADSFERGEFASAAWIGRRLIQLHPSLVAERASVLFQTALAEHLAGNDVQAQQKLAELTTKYPDSTATVGGADVKLAEALAAELKQRSSLVRTFRSDSWPMPFGTPDASAVPEQISTGGARLFGIEINGLPSRSARNRPNRGFQQTMPLERRLGSTTGILPSIDDGELFFQDNARVYAINLASGLPLTGWQQTYPGEKRGVYAIDASPVPPGTQLAVNVTADRVIAVLGQTDQISVMMGMAQQQQQQQATLVSLDRDTGRRQWSATLNKLKLPDDLATLRDGTFYGTPLVEGDSIYTLVRVVRGGQFEECHLVALQLSDGAYKWSSYIASTAAGSRFQDIDSDSAGTGATAQVSYSDGRLYVLTNLGAVACINASDGNTLWLNVYARSADIGEGGPMAMQRRFIQQPRAAGKPYTINPPIITDGRLFVMPSDSPSLFVYDAASGELVSEIARRLDLGRRDDRYHTMDMLLAVRGEKLVLANRSTVVSMPWRRIDPKKSLVDNGGVYTTFIGSDGDASEAIRGRPFVSQKYLLVPTLDKLVRIAIEPWKIENTYPASGKWDEEEQAGNVLATPDHLIIAGPSRVTAYTDLGIATAKLDQRIAQTPNEVEPYLRYAELLLAGGKAADAVPYLDKAVERLGGAKSLQPGELRDRLFEICCSFAIKLQRAASAGTTVTNAPVEVIRQLYDRARDAADKPQQHVRYRLALASLLRGENEAANELALHQQVLANADWRTAPVAGRNGASTAGAESAQAIAEIVQQAGSAIYAPYEAKAAELLSAAEADPAIDGERLLAIADEFPTSTASTQALTLAAEKFETTQPRLASQTLRRLLKRDLSTERRLVTLESLARTYLATPGQLDTAIVRLQQAARLNGTAQLTRPITIPDGRTLERVTYAAASELLQKYRNSAITAALPTLGTPSTSMGADPTLAALQPAVEVAAASDIVYQQADLARHDRVVAYSSKGVIQLTVGSRQPNGKPVTFSEAPLGCAYSGDSLIVVGATQAMAINGDGTQTLWRLSLSQLPGAEIAAAPAREPEATDDDENKDVVMPFPRAGRINLRNRGIVIAGNMPAEIDPVAAGGPERIFNYRVLSDRLVIGTTSGRVVSVDLATGRTTWQTRPSEQTIRHFLTTEDFVVVSYTEQNPNTGQQTSEVVVLDAISGQITQRNTYTAESGQQLINLALSRDGVLVAMLPRGLRARDLYDPKSPEWKQDAIGGAMQNNEMPLAGSSAAEQMVISDDRVLVIYRANTGQQSVRAYKLRDELKPMKFRDEKTNREFEASYGARLKPEANDNSPLSIRAVGPAFYIFGQKSLAAYNLDKPQSQWSPSSANPPIARDLILGQDVAALICNPAGVPNPAVQRMQAIQLLLYSRLPTASGNESGVLDQRITVRDQANIVVGQWQVANGAFYYVSGDQKLKMMTATPTPPKK